MIKPVVKSLLWLASGLVLTVSALIILALENAPGVVAASHQQVNQAESVQQLMRQLRYSIKQRYREQDILLTEAQLNSLTGFAQRAVPAFRGAVQVQPDRAVVHTSYQLPGWLAGRYLNTEVVVLPGTELVVESVRVGDLYLPGNWVLNALVTMVDWHTQSDLASNTLHQVKHVQMFNQALLVSMRPMDSLLKDLNNVRNGIGSQQDEALRQRTAHYLAFLDQLNDRLPQVTHSLSTYLTALMQHASSRSQVMDYAAWQENEAALIALAIFAGHHRFANFVGDVQPRTDRVALPKYRPVLAGRTDLSQHFIFSAAIKILSRKGISAAIGEFKELMDRSRSGSGYSFVDLAADLAGIRFAEAALDPAKAGKVQIRIALAGVEAEFFPNIDGLPEGLSKPEFTRQFGEVDSEAYLAMMDEIERRLDDLPLYQQELISASRLSGTTR